MFIGKNNLQSVPYFHHFYCKCLTMSYAQRKNNLQSVPHFNYFYCKCLIMCYIHRKNNK
jgi:hypothetical protein